MRWCTWHTCQKPRLPNHKWLCKTHCDLERLLNGQTNGHSSVSLQINEQYAIKNLIEQRGFNFVYHFLKPASVQPSQIVDMYQLKDIDENTYNRIMKLLQEFLPLRGG